MNNIFIQFQPLIQAIGWTLLHSIWQGLLIFCALKLIIKALPTSRSSLRYNMSLLALVSLVLWSVITFYDQWEKAIVTTTNSIALNNTDLLLQNNISNTTLLQQLLVYLDTNMNTIVQLYIAGVLLLLGRVAYNIYALKRIKDSSPSFIKDQYQELLNKSLAQLNIRSKVLLTISDKINVPMVIGTLKPMILLPLASVNNLTTAQVETIILHELAHIKRHDYLINIIQVIIETLLFYNPSIWLISKQIRTEREFCCDDIVTNNTDAKVHYAQALAQLSELQSSNKLSVAATGSNKHKLLNRIKRIIEMKKTPINKTQFTFVTIIITALMLSVTMFSPSLLAQSKRDDDDTVVKTDDKQKNVKVEVITEEITVIDDDGNVTRYDKMEDMPQKHKKLLYDVGENVMFGPDKKFVSKSGDSFIVSMVIDELDETVDRDGLPICPVEGVDSIMSDNNKQVIIMRKNIADAHKQMRDAQQQLADAQRSYAKAKQQIMIADRKKLIARADSTRKSVMIVKTIRDSKDGTAYKARARSYDVNGVLDQLYKDGLIDKNDKYSIEIKDKALYINGIKQDDKVLNKYFKEEKNAKKFIMEGSKNNTSVEIVK